MVTPGIFPSKYVAITAHQAYVRLSFLLSESVVYIVIPTYINSSNLIENDHNFVFFDCKVPTQQHFESRLFLKKCRETEKTHSLAEPW